MSFPVPLAAKRSASGVPTGRLAMWWVIGSEIVIFGGLLVSYILMRTMYDHWSEYAAATNIIFGSINTFVLLTSSLSIVLAHHYSQQGDGQKAFKFIWLTILGGAIFICVKAVEWTMEIQAGYTITANVFWSFYYTAAGIHACHVIGGAIAMGIVSIDVRKNKNLQRVEIVGNYWHFVDLVWIFLFPLLYIAK